MLDSFGKVTDNLHDFKPVNEIFIVEDNEHYRELLAAILELEGFKVTVFPEGTSFLCEAFTRVPICVFLDIVMPGPSGLDILKTLNAKNYAPPVFLISARSDSAAVVQAMKSGAQDFIEKPFDPYTAVLRVREAVEFWGRRAANAIVPDLSLPRFFDGVPLSHMERDVLTHIVAGAANAEVAEALGISKQSVANHRWRITKKLGAKNSADLVRIVLSKIDRRNRPPRTDPQVRSAIVDAG
jgi:two-component system, LuxR family, response regulator FixJ